MSLRCGILFKDRKGRDLGLQAHQASALTTELQLPALHIVGGGKVVSSALFG